MLFLVIIVFSLAMALGGMLARGQSKGPAVGLYYLEHSVFTPAERSFLGVLDDCAGDGCRVLAKVRLADIFGVRKGLGRSRWQSAFNRICAKHVDFLLVRASDGAPLLGIELDDGSHDEPARKERDGFVDSVFRSAGLPVLHIPARRAYDPRELRRQIEAALRPQLPASPPARERIRPGAGVA